MVDLGLLDSSIQPENASLSLSLSGLTCSEALRRLNPGKGAPRWLQRFRIKQEHRNISPRNEVNHIRRLLQWSPTFWIHSNECRAALMPLNLTHGRAMADCSMRISHSQGSALPASGWFGRTATMLISSIGRTPSRIELLGNPGGLPGTAVQDTCRLRH